MTDLQTAWIASSIRPDSWDIPEQSAHVVRAWLDKTQQTIEHHGTHHAIVKLSGICQMDGTRLSCLLTLGHYVQSGVESTFLLSFYVNPSLRDGELSRQMLSQTAEYLQRNSFRCCSPLKACMGKFAASPGLRDLFKAAGFTVSNPSSQKDIVMVEFQTGGRSKRISTENATAGSFQSSHSSTSALPSASFTASDCTHEYTGFSAADYIGREVTKTTPRGSLEGEVIHASEKGYRFTVRWYDEREEPFSRSQLEPLLRQQPATPLPSSLKEPQLCSSRVGEEFQAVVPAMSSKRPSSSVVPTEPSAKSPAVVMDRSTQRRINEMEKQIATLTTQNQALTAEKQTMETKLQTLGEKLGRLQIIETREQQLRRDMGVLQGKYDDKVAEVNELAEKIRKMPSPAVALSNVRSKLLLLIRKYA